MGRMTSAARAPPPLGLNWVWRKVLSLDEQALTPGRGLAERSCCKYISDDSQKLHGAADVWQARCNTLYYDVWVIRNSTTLEADGYYEQRMATMKSPLHPTLQYVSF
ncbi:unnamed protein product [Gadus morhua 'NCC']